MLPVVESTDVETPTAEENASGTVITAAAVAAAQAEAARARAAVETDAAVDEIAVETSAPADDAAAVEPVTVDDTAEPEPAEPVEPADAAQPAEVDAADSAAAEPEVLAAPAAEPEVLADPAAGPEVLEAAAATAVAVIAAPTTARNTPRKKRTLRVARAAPSADAPRALLIDGLVKQFGGNTAVDHISLEVRAGSFYGIVGPNGAGKTTTLSMVTGLLRPDAGSVRIHDIDVWADPVAAKRATGVLPDRLRLFDRLTGGQLLAYSGSLRGLDSRTVRERSADLIAAFGLDDAVDRLVADYSAGMTKKVALACAMIHAPRLLVLDEPFESVDPVSAANLTDILERYVAGGGTVVLSSHGMDLIERVCDSAAIIVGGRVLASGTLDEVRQGETLEDRFVELAGGRKAAEGMEWLHSFSD